MSHPLGIISKLGRPPLRQRSDTASQKLDETAFDPHKKTAIYKFANDLSHHTGKTFDPALVAETQKNVTYLLEMIEAVAPLHFTGLKLLSEA